MISLIRNILKAPPVHNERGMTMIELMVAMTLGGILMTIAVQFLFTGSNTILEKRMLAETQQELRWAIQLLDDHVRLAGNGVPSGYGWDMLNSVNMPGGEPDTLTIMGSFKSLDITCIRPLGSEGAQVMVDHTEGINIGDLIFIADDVSSEVFLCTNINDQHLWHAAEPPWNPTNKLSHRYQAGSIITVISQYVFYVDKNVETGESNLMMSHHYYGPQVLAGNVEDFQVRFKMNDGNWVDEFDPEDLFKVHLVEINMRGRTEDEIPAFTDPQYGDGYKRLVIKQRMIPRSIVNR